MTTEEMLKNNPDKPVLLVDTDVQVMAAEEILGDRYVVSNLPIARNPKGIAVNFDWKPFYGRKLLLWTRKNEIISERLHKFCPEIKIIEPEFIKIPGEQNEGLPPKFFDSVECVIKKWTFEDFVAWAKPRTRLYEPKPDSGDVEIEVSQATQNGDLKTASRTRVKIHTQEDDSGLDSSHIAKYEKYGVEFNKSGPTNNADNVLRVFENREEFKDFIWYDEFHNDYLTTLNLRTFENEEKPHAWDEKIDPLYMTNFFQRHLGFKKLDDSITQKAVLMYAHQRTRNEPKEWLNNLVWDGKDRIAGFFCSCFGVEINEFSTAISKNFWIAMVARILDPGCQMDNMVILEGKQGSYKSSALRLIGGDWGVECGDDVLSKDFQIGLIGRNLVIINEWDKFRKADIPTMKDIISRPADNFRGVYGKRHNQHRRTCVFVATTNKKRYLLDTTGARRFWPLKTNTINKNMILEVREQCYAEAVHRFKAGEKWWEMPEGFEKEQEDRRVVDPWEELIEDWVDSNPSMTITIQTVAKECLRLLVDRQDRRTSNRIAECLRTIGFEDKRENTGIKTEVVWRRV